MFMVTLVEVVNAMTRKQRKRPDSLFEMGFRCSALLAGAAGIAQTILPPPLHDTSRMLADPDHRFVPIQWKGYNQALDQYQGEILNKNRLQEKYLKVVSEAEASQKVRDRHDWEPMIKVFEALFEAFR